MNIVEELRQKYPLRDLIKISGISRSTYFYVRKRNEAPDKDADLKNQISTIYNKNTKGKEKYGYRRVYAELRKIDQYSHVNHKKVQRIMQELGFFGYISKNGNKKYSSYKGTIGKIADNEVRRHFKAEKPNTLWSTDVTEFNLPECNNTKVYLSPIKDFCDGSIVSHSCSTSPNLKLVMDMLDKAFDKYGCLAGLVFHSDQGWQYQHKTWAKRLDDRCIVQSMSRKGNCLDNSKMETFFGTIKKAIWFGQEHKYKTPEELIAAIDDYIDWYNKDRIQTNLKGLSPLQYRKQAFKITA